MSELTKEYFDKQISGLRSDMDKRFDAVDKRFELVERKMDDKFDEVARMTANGFADLQKRLDVNDRVQVLEKQMKKIASALNVSL